MGWNSAIHNLMGFAKSKVFFTIRQLEYPTTKWVVERVNKTLLEKMRVLLITSSLLKSFWVEIAHTAVFLVNQLVEVFWKIKYL